MLGGGAGGGGAVKMGGAGIVQCITKRCIVSRFCEGESVEFR